MIQFIMVQTIHVNMCRYLCTVKGMKEGKELPIRQTFADIGATVAENFNVKMPKHGKSFLKELN